MTFTRPGRSVLPSHPCQRWGLPPLNKLSHLSSLLVPFPLNAHRPSSRANKIDHLDEFRSTDSLNADHPPSPTSLSSVPLPAPLPSRPPLPSPPPPLRPTHPRTRSRDAKFPHLPTRVGCVTLHCAVSKLFTTNARAARISPAAGPCGHLHQRRHGRLPPQQIDRL